MLDTDGGSLWPKRWKWKKGDGTDKALRKLVQIDTRKVRRGGCICPRDHKSCQGSNDSSPIFHDTRSATPRPCEERQTKVRQRSWPSTDMTKKKVQAPRWTLDDLEAKAGKIEERRKVACPEITHALNCVVTTRPLTTPVVQDMDTDDEDVRVLEAKAKK